MEGRNPDKFDNDRLDDVLTRLSQIYPVDFVIIQTPELAAARYHATFNGDSLLGHLESPSKSGFLSDASLSIRPIRLNVWWCIFILPYSSRRQSLLKSDDSVHVIARFPPRRWNA